VNPITNAVITVDGGENGYGTSNGITLIGGSCYLTGSNQSVIGILLLFLFFILNNFFELKQDGNGVKNGHIIVNPYGAVLEGVAVPALGKLLLLNTIYTVIFLHNFGQFSYL
jgi:hypothetical protein